MKRNIKPIVKSEVDIVTPIYGGLEFWRMLSISLLEQYDAGVNFHWYVVDDATPIEKGSTEIIKFGKELETLYSNVTFIQNKINGGYAKANNIGFAKGRADYVLMLNSDTKIKQDNWLKALLEPIKVNPAVGVVGAKLLFFEDSKVESRPAGMTQHAGVAFNALKQPYHIFLGWPPDHHKVNERRVMRVVTGACLLTRRNIIRRLKGLDEVYTTGNFEDVEFCIRAGLMGSVVLYEPAVELYHYGGGSNNTATAIRNQQIFQMRNGNFLSWDDWRYY